MLFLAIWGASAGERGLLGPVQGLSSSILPYSYYAAMRLLTIYYSSSVISDYRTAITNLVNTLTYIADFVKSGLIASCFKSFHGLALTAVMFEILASHDSSLSS